MCASREVPEPIITPMLLLVIVVEQFREPESLMQCEGRPLEPVGSRPRR